MYCKYAQIKIKTDTNRRESICVCGHPMYLNELESLADALSSHGKVLIPNKECQYVRDLDYTQCPFIKENN